VGDDDGGEEATADEETAGDEVTTEDDWTALAFPGLPGPAGEGCRLAAAAGCAWPTPEANL
jgi:hypothetical protein